MLTLAIDTSTRVLSMALVEGGRCVSFRNLVLHRRMAEVIVPEIKKFLAKKDYTLNDIQAFIVGRGPGSFTSLRVGLATIKGLCFNTDVVVAGVSSLDAIAAATYKRVEMGSHVCVISDARRDLLYAATYTINKEIPERTTEYQLISWKDLKKQLRKPMFFAGDGVSLVLDEISQKFGPKAALIDKLFVTPQARFLLPSGLQQLASGSGTDANLLEPLYLYEEDCQVRK